MASWQIKFDNLTLGYDRHPVVHHFSETLTSGQMVALVGSNGGGKSTLLKALVGELMPLSGAIQFEGLVRAGLAYLPQSTEMDRDFPMNVEGFLMTGIWSNRGAFARVTRQDKEACRDVLEAVGMSAFREAPLNQLSGGQFQRVRFARLLMQPNECLVLDEPFVGMDEETQQDLMKLLKRLHWEGKTILCVLHDFALVREAFPTTWMLSRECIASGATADVLTEHNLAHMMENSLQRQGVAHLCQQEGEANA